MSTRRRSERKQKRPVSPVPADDADSLSALPPRVAVTSGRFARGGDDGSGAETFRVEKAVPTPSRPLPPANDFSSDSESSEEVFVRSAARPAASATAPAFVTDASEADTFRFESKPAAAPPPPILKRKSEGGSGGGVRSEQEKRRNVAFAEMDAIRQTGARIQNYNDTAELADRRESERDVVIDEKLFDTLLKDTPGEYQNANKPPWAPRLPPHILAELQTWEAIEVLSELEQRKKDWYTMVEKVAGLLFLPVSSLVRFVPTTQSSDAVAPSRSAVSGNYGGGGDLESGPATADRALAALTGFTPARPVEPDEPMPFFGAAAGGGGGGGLPPEPDPRRDEEDGNVLLEPLETGQLNSVLFSIVESVFQEDVARDGPQIAQSGARQQELRKAAEARAPERPYYAGDVNTDEARLLNQRVRSQAALARAWVGRSLATGVFYLAPEYTAARDAAYADILSRAPQLGEAQLYHFIRNGPTTNSVQSLVRQRFARMIQHTYNLARHNSGRAAKLAGDAANISRAAEDTLRWFASKVAFDDGEFSELQQQQRSVGGRFAPIFLPPVRSDSRQPLFDPRSDQPALLNPLLYTPGTMLNRRRF